ncbi:MAG: Adenylate cyclase [Pseudomonadota bacterium]|jgi:class 3 adenylate cyclase
MSSKPQSNKEEVSIEKFRSNFRHDLRSNFSVLIGFGEVLREDLSRTNSESLATLDAALDAGRMALDDTIAMINRCSLSSISAFKTEVRAGLRKGTLSNLREVNEMLAKLVLNQDEQELVDNMLEAVRQLTLRCHSPFDQRLELRTQEINFQVNTVNESSDAPTRGHVMVIDDEPHNLHLIGTFLGRLNLSVSTFTRGEDALAELANGGVDLILLDLHMPQMSGLEFLRQIKSKKEYQEIPVLVVTASDDADELAECIEAGAVDSLPKPFQSSFLKARVLTSLDLQAAKRRERAIARELVYQKGRIEELLSVILPRDIIDELQSTGEVQPKRHERVCVLFCDIVNFTESCDREDPVKILALLQSLFSEFEAITELQGLQKIKTIGDSFMAAIGLNQDVNEEELELRAIQAGLNMIDCARRHESGWQLRVGLHTGPVVSGLVGNKQFLFDIWGDTVNTAARVEGASKPQRVAISRTVFDTVKDKIKGQNLGKISLKGKGEQEIYLVEEIIRHQ